MTYNAEIAEPRRQIDRLDSDICDKILELSQAIKCYKQKIDLDKGYNPFVNSEIGKLALKYNLDVQALSKIFKEIMQLTGEMEVNPR